MCEYVCEGERELVCQVWEIFLLHVTNLAKLIWIVHIQNELIRKYTVWPFSLSLAKRQLGCPVRYREQRRERPLLLLLLEKKKEQLAYQGDASSTRYCALSLNFCLGSQMYATILKSVLLNCSSLLQATWIRSCVTHTRTSPTDRDKRQIKFVPVALKWPCLKSESGMSNFVLLFFSLGRVFDWLSNRPLSTHSYWDWKIRPTCSKLRPNTSPAVCVVGDSLVPHSRGLVRCSAHVQATARLPSGLNKGQMIDFSFTSVETL